MDISTLYHNIPNLLLQTQLILESPNILNTRQGRTLETNLVRSSKRRAEEKTLLKAEDRKIGYTFRTAKL
jgi:hypothetical protein